MMLIRNTGLMIVITFQALANKGGVKRAGDFIEQPDPKKPPMMMQQEGALTEQVNNATFLSKVYGMKIATVTGFLPLTDPGEVF